jgi:hypothetical protein
MMFTFIYFPEPYCSYRVRDMYITEEEQRVIRDDN